MGRCDGRVAFVTGASRGIGKAIARRFAAEGAAVVVNFPVMGEEKGLPGTLVTYLVSGFKAMKCRSRGLI